MIPRQYKSIALMACILTTLGICLLVGARTVQGLLNGGSSNVCLYLCAPLFIAYAMLRYRMDEQPLDPVIALCGAFWTLGFVSGAITAAVGLR